MNIPAADSPRLAVALAPTTAGDICGEDADLTLALAYIATAEGTAAQMAERACDRAGLDFAACPVEILEAADKRVAELRAIEVADFLAAVYRNPFAVVGADIDLRRDAAKQARADIAKNEARAPYKGKADITRQLWKRYHRVNPD